MSQMSIVNDSFNGIKHVKVFIVKDEYIELENSRYEILLKVFDLIKSYNINHQHTADDKIDRFLGMFKSGYFIDCDRKSSYRMNTAFAKEIGDYLYDCFNDSEFYLYTVSNYGDFSNVMAVISSLKDVTR